MLDGTGRKTSEWAGPENNGRVSQPILERVSVSPEELGAGAIMPKGVAPERSPGMAVKKKGTQPASQMPGVREARGRGRPVG